jgi:hypothetical protein
LYSLARALLITADGGGSNGSRLRLWKLELQKLADETGLSISVCHFPPGTSKWNKVEHRLFSFISSNWRGEPLRDYETIVNLISRTTTAKGLQVTCRLLRHSREITLLCSPKVTHHHDQLGGVLPPGKSAVLPPGKSVVLPRGNCSVRACPCPPPQSNRLRRRTVSPATSARYAPLARMM